MDKFIDYIQTKNIEVRGIIHVGKHSSEKDIEYIRLVPEKDKIIWVDIEPEQVEKVRKTMIILDRLVYEKIIQKGINILVTDIEGAELLALKGADKSLHYFDMIYSTNKNIELNSFLEEYGFNTEIEGLIYVKKSLQDCNREDADIGRVWNMLKHKITTLVDTSAKGSQYVTEEGQKREYHLFEQNLKHFSNLCSSFMNDQQVFLSNITLGDRKRHVNINSRFHEKEEINTVYQDTLDNYCAKMDINRINFLKIGENTEHVLKGANNILETTDYVLFTGKNLQQVYETLYKKGFKYIYCIGKKCLLYQSSADNNETGSYIAMRTTWQEAIQPIPKLAIACINLEKSTERRKLLVDQTNKLGLPYTIFRAVDGKRIDVIDNIAYYENMKFPCVSRYHRKLSYGEMGCFISHILVCKQLLKTDNEYFLILEDDNKILDINLARQQLMNIPDVQFDLCFMSASMNTFTPTTEKINDYFSRTTKRNFNRTNAVLYRRSGLEKIIANFETTGMILPYDNFLEVLQFNIITANTLLYYCMEEYPSDIWTIYKENEYYNDVKYDKPSYKGKLTMDMNGHAQMGNCLFQYAFMKAQALEKTMKIVLPAECRELSAFPNISCAIGSVTDTIQLNETKFEHDQKLCDSISSDHNYSLGGYFQTEKYFEKYKEVIIDNFRMDYRYINFAKREYCLLSGGKKLCGVHIRLPNITGEIGALHTTPSEKFVSQAIATILEKEPQTKFVVCSNDIEECSRVYSKLFPPHTVFSRGGKYEDFALLSFCDNNIITIGTYGWWAAYLNKSPDKIIVCMTPMFNQTIEKTKNNNECDFYPKDWIVIQN